MQPKTYADVVELPRASSDAWPAPDYEVLSAGRRTPPVMPSEMFGSLWPLLVDLADNAGAPVDYVAMSVLAGAASLIGGKRKVRPFETSDWAEPAILWVGLVGEPSSNKTPALRAATKPFASLERDYEAQHDAALLDYTAKLERAKAEQAEYRERVKAAAKDGLSTPPCPESAVDPVKPIARRLLTMDNTTEALGALLETNPVGILCYRDEIAGWIASFDRYAPGGRSFWLEAFQGGRYTVDRKSADRPIRVPFLGVSLVGGIQPDKLAEGLLSGADDGLVPRFLWSWPDPVPFTRPAKRADASHLETVYRRLDALAWGRDELGKEQAVTLPLSSKAADLFERWGQANDEGAQDHGALYKGFVGKMKGAVLRLALVVAQLEAANDGVPEPVAVSERVFGSVLDFVDSYAKPTALRVFGDAALPGANRNAAQLARYIRRHRLAKFNARTLGRQQGALPFFRDAAARAEAIAVLVEADWLREAPTRSGETYGRKSQDYLVNPKALEG